MYLAGYNIIDTRNFAWWKAMESVLCYIRPHDPDMERFVPDFELYCQSRKRKSVIFGENDEAILAMLERKNSKKARYMQSDVKKVFRVFNVVSHIFNRLPPFYLRPGNKLDKSNNDQLGGLTFDIRNPFSLQTSLVCGFVVAN